MDKCKRCRYNKENTEIINYDEMYKEQKIIVRGYCECNRCGYIRPNSFYVKYFDLSDRYMVNKYNINLAAIRRPKNSSPGDKYFCNICNRETYLYYINTDYYNCPYKLGIISLFYYYLSVWILKSVIGLILSIFLFVLILAW